MRICLDYGHGGKDVGVTFGNRKESEDVLMIGKVIAQRLRDYGVEVGETRTTDRSISTEERIRFANEGGYGYFISLHRNACAPATQKGVQVLSDQVGRQTRSGRLARRLQAGLVRVGFDDREVKKICYYTLVGTHMPAVHIELGFINHPVDQFLWDVCQEEMVEAIVKAIIG
ncbi:MAG: N-acetylmuramoyl-L-alanine amidase family protein [Cellulosilyticaceae bacterium]